MAPRKKGAATAARKTARNKKEPPVIEGELSVAEAQQTALSNDPETQMVAQRLQALTREVKWDLPLADGQPLTGEALRAWILHKEEAAAIALVERGVGFMLLKRELGHGAFGGWLEDNGISPRAAQRSMKSAQLLMTLSDSNATRASHLPARKLDVLASMPSAVVDDMFAEGELDSIEEMSRDQLREIVRLRKQIERQEAREARLNQVISEQDEALRKRRALPETQQHVAELRRAVLEETEALRVCAHQIQSVMDRAAMLPPDMEPAERDAVIHPLMYALQGLHATAAALFDRGFELFDGYQSDVEIMPPRLSEAEVAEAKRRTKHFDEEAQLREKLRQIDLAPVHKGRQRG